MIRSEVHKNPAVAEHPWSFRVPECGDVGARGGAQGSKSPDDVGLPSELVFVV
jgi:hypothetical protein